MWNRIENPYLSSADRMHKLNWEPMNHLYHEYSQKWLISLLAKTRAWSSRPGSFIWVESLLDAWLHPEVNDLPSQYTAACTEIFLPVVWFACANIIFVSVPRMIALSWLSTYYLFFWYVRLFTASKSFISTSDKQKENRGHRPTSCMIQPT